MTKYVTTKRILTFFTPYHARPSDAIGSSLEGHEKNVGEIGWKMKGWEQFQERIRYNAILKDFPKKDFQIFLMMVGCSVGCSVGWHLLRFIPWEKNNASIPARYRHVQNEWCQTPSCSAMFSLNTLSIYLEYFPAWGSYAKILLEAKLVKIIPYVSNVSAYFSKITFDDGGIFLKYS